MKSIINIFKRLTLKGVYTRRESATVYILFSLTIGLINYAITSFWTPDGILGGIYSYAVFFFQLAVVTRIMNKRCMDISGTRNMMIVMTVICACMYIGLAGLLFLVMFIRSKGVDSMYVAEDLQFTRDRYEAYLGAGDQEAARAEAEHIIAIYDSCFKRNSEPAQAMRAELMGRLTGMVQ